MKILRLVTITLVASSLSAQAQFNSGSTGANGALNVTSNTTLDLPPDGIFHFTTITVASNATLRFNRNAKNTPVYLLATGDVRIDGTIDVSGANAQGRLGAVGGPGGFDGGFAGDGPSIPPGSGHGPGGGKGGSTAPGAYCWGASDSAGCGSYATSATVHYQSINQGALYGSALLVPLLGGSGGGGTTGSPGIGGGGGGGGILIASSTRITVTANGIIRANGGRGYIPTGCSQDADINPGSGGAVRFVAPAVEGTGYLLAAGPRYGGVEASHGRIRIDSLDRRNLNLNTAPFRYVGNYMVVFPSTRLDIIEVAGTSIAEGSGPVTIQLPNNSSTNRTVTVQARNFNGFVPFEVALVAESGHRIVYTNTIDNASSNPATNTITVGVPANTPVTISAWTKVP